MQPYEQFRRVANMYFLSVAIISLFEVGRCTLTPPDPYIHIVERRLVSTLAPIK
jgi:hypothetical protein